MRLRPSVLAASLLVSGCGVGKGAPQWIGSDAAVVRCTIAGPNFQLPPLLDELPSPALPTGLFARAMDPIALDQLGFERERAVCATLIAPEAAELDAAMVAIDELVEARNDLAKQARKLGRCLCSYADELDARALVIGCVAEPTRQRCDAESEQVATLAELLAPVEAKLEAARVPRTHWRLFGKTDRPGRFLDRSDQIIGRHLGGSEIYQRRSALPPVAGAKLIAALLALEHVVAVVRQDSGRALVVVREIDDLLILDHFAYPELSGAGDLDVERMAMLGHVDDRQIDRYRAALAPPAQARELLFDPRDGYLVELDRAGLERVDRALLVAAHYAGLRYDEGAEQRVLPALLVDRFAHQVPFGSEGKLLRARARLSEEGRRWFDGVADQPAFEALAQLAAAKVSPQFSMDAATGADLTALFVLRGQPVEQLSFSGVDGLAAVFQAIELAAAKSIDGPIEDFEVALPSGPLPGGFDSRPGIEALRERLSIAPHELEVERIAGGQVLALELRPR